MAFYKDMGGKKTRQERGNQGGWDDEGSRYKKKPEQGAREGAKPQDKQGFKPRDGKPAYQPRDGKPAFHTQERKPAPVERKPAPVERKPAPVERRPAPEAPRFERYEQAPQDEPINLLSGRNPIREAIKAGRDIEKLLVAQGDLSGSAREIVALAREARIPVQVVERSRLDAITRNHQGMLAFASAYKYHEVEDMLALAKERGEKPFLIILDGVTDPQNLGAIIRTASCVGAHGVIVPLRRAVGLTPAAVKASAGAIEQVMVARVTNVARTLEQLKAEGVWLYAADMQGEDYRTVDFDGACALVIGAEGEGVSRLVLSECDRRVKLPMRGTIGSLNASVAAGVLLYAAFSARSPV